MSQLNYEQLLFASQTQYLTFTIFLHNLNFYLSSLSPTVLVGPTLGNVLEWHLLLLY